MDSSPPEKECFSEASYYLWCSNFGGMSVPDVKSLQELDTENARLNKLLAQQVLENEVIKATKVGDRTGRRELVHDMMNEGLRGRRALAVMRMKGSCSVQMK